MARSTAGAAGRCGRAPLVRRWHRGEAGIAQVEGDSGQQVHDADRGELDADGAEAAARVGTADRVHRDRLRIAGEWFAAEITAPADVAGPGGAVGGVACHRNGQDAGAPVTAAVRRGPYRGQPWQ
jgi:hypothetical protein